jgi:hypothetical protein
MLCLNLAFLKENLSVEKEMPYFVILSGKLENKQYVEW